MEKEETKQPSKYAKKEWSEKKRKKGQSDGKEEEIIEVRKDIITTK